MKKPRAKSIGTTVFGHTDEKRKEDGKTVERNRNQHIGCEVKSCRWNEGGAHCALSSISVRPARHCDSGRENESFCGSYESDCR